MAASIDGPEPDGPTVPGGNPAPDESPVDIGAFREQMREAGVESVVPQILALFAEHLPERWAAIETAIESRDEASVSRAAHALRSAAASVYATRLHGILDRLETIAMEEGVVDECRALAEEAQAEVIRIQSQLETL